MTAARAGEKKIGVAAEILSITQNQGGKPMTYSTCPSTTPTVEPLLVDARRAAEMCGVSRSTWLGWDAGGINPRPVKIGGRVLWPVEHLRTWAAAGCPSREQLEGIEEGLGNG